MFVNLFLLEPQLIGLIIVLTSDVIGSHQPVGSSG